MSRPQDHSAAGRIISMKTSRDIIGNRTRDLPACNAMHQPTAPPRTPINVRLHSVMPLNRSHIKWRFRMISSTTQDTSSKEQLSSSLRGSDRKHLSFQVREKYPICVQSQNTTKHNSKFITLLQHYNNMFRPKLSAILRLYMKPIVCMP